MIADKDVIERALKDFNSKLSNFAKYLCFSEGNNVHDEWVSWLFAANNKKTFRQLLAHRGSYKTTIISLAIARHLLFCPESRVGVVRSNKEEGKMFLRMVRSILLSERFIYLIFSLGFVGANSSLLLIDNADSLVLSYRKGNFKEGNLDAIGYEQSITGRHYDILLFDDFVTIEDRLSPVIRKKKYIYANEFIHNILNPIGLAINLGTFWHKEDSNQRFKEAYQKDDELIFEEKLFPIGKVFNESKKEIMKFRESKIKSLGQALYSANYELIDKQDEDLPFSNLSYDDFVSSGQVIATVDPGYGGDRTAISIGSKKDDRIFVVGKIYQQSVYDLINEIASILTNYQVSKCYVEINADKGATVAQLKGKVVTDIEGYSSTKNKQYRIMSNLKPRWHKIFFDMSKSDSDYLIEISEWNALASRDDAPDSLEKLLEVIDTITNVAHPDTWG